MPNITVIISPKANPHFSEPTDVCHNKFRLRKRVDSSRRDAVEAGFEPRDAVLRCHSTQSLRDAQAFNRSEFQASDLVSSNPSGRTSVSHTVLNSVAPSVSSSNSRIATKVRPTASRSSHDYNEVHQQYLIEEPQKRRSLQALNANSLYQMTSDRMANSEQWPQEEHIFNGQHHGICDSTTPTFPNDHRRSVQNDSRNSFFDGVRMTSTPKSRVAVAPQQQKPRYSSGSRDELHLRNPNERRNSGGANLSAVQSYMLRHGGEERLVDGPITTSEGARVAYLERKVRELEEMMSQQPQPSTSVLQLTPVTQARHARNAPPTQLIISNNGSTVAEQIRMQEMTEQLSSKEKKVAELEKKLLKAYTRIEKQQEEFDDKVRGVISDSERARDDLTRMVERMRQLEAEAEVLRSHSAYGDNANEQAYRELQDKIWKQDREIKDQRIQMEKLRGKEAEFEKMRSEMVYLEMQNEELNKTLEAKKTVVEELERNVNTMRLEQTLCQQSCSSGSTPLAEDSESMADVIRPSLTRPYTKAHSTLGSNMSPLPHAKSSGLTKSFSNFAIDVTKRDDITAAMSRSIRTQQRQITLSRLMVRCLRDTVEKLARGENPDVCRLLGIKTDSMSESEFEGEQTAEESKPFSMMAAEKALHKQERGLKELDSDLEAIRQSVAVWYESTLERNGQGDEACRVQ
ncbi:unnamed protein product [Caenorhabditis auriculariae]|uniref:Uncharacterized protein n=1 Tax=Caenorhabditis auriculariae TaxID=2777116 RepID=A0A8S1HTX8_9PELO|nr:unnamed protein product [Caenorhabditis auriculariae]